MRNKFMPGILACAVVACGVVAVQHHRHCHPLPSHWSTSIYWGRTPFDLHPLPGAHHPLLPPEAITGASITDVADPFLAREGDTWILFVEVVGKTNMTGSIACATSTNLTDWTYRGLVIHEPFHMSYPYVFKWDNTWYMMPESRRANDIRLYKAVSFPDKWVLAGSLIEGEYKDSSIVHHNGMWWILTVGKYGKLYVFYADKLEGPWRPHPRNPVRQDWHTTRGGGRIINYQGRLYRFVQDVIPAYGGKDYAMQITTLTTNDFSEERVGTQPILQASYTGWNAIGMHTIDPHEVSNSYWIAAVDGLSVETNECPAAPK